MDIVVLVDPDGGFRKNRAAEGVDGFRGRPGSGRVVEEPSVNRPRRRVHIFHVGDPEVAVRLIRGGEARVRRGLDGRRDGVESRRTVSLGEFAGGVAVAYHEILADRVLHIAWGNGVPVLEFEALPVGERIR